MSFRGAGSLATNDEAADFDGLAVLAVFEVNGAVGVF